MRRTWTLGHSTLAWDAFPAPMRAACIEAVADVRRFPASRRHPQFSAGAMAHALPAAGIAYVPMTALGSRRSPRADSPHTAWRTCGFRGYADYMDTPAYSDARDALEALATGRRTSILCAEAPWWQCHRGPVFDDLKVRGWDVLHLAASGRAEPRSCTRAARIVDGVLDYAAPAVGQGTLFGG